METSLSIKSINKTQIEVISIAEGFLQSSIIFALLKLKIFERLDQGPKSVHELSEELGARAETLLRLLNAGVVLRLLETKDSVHYSIAPGCREVLSPSSGDNYIGDWIHILDYFQIPLSRLDEAVLHSQPTVDPSFHLGGSREDTRSFTFSMHNYASLRGKELAKFLSTKGCLSLLDLGCGPGTYAFHLGLQNPELEIYLADHPVVLETASEVQRKFQLQNNIHLTPMDVLRDEIVGTYDIILVSNVLHGLGEEHSRALIQRLYRSVNEGGSLVIQAQFLRDDKLGGRWPIFLDLIQMCVTFNGRNHSVSETRAWLADAGFQKIEFCPMTLLNTNSYLRGYK